MSGVDVLSTRAALVGDEEVGLLVALRLADDDAEALADAEPLALADGDAVLDALAEALALADVLAEADDEADALAEALELADADALELPDAAVEGVGERHCGKPGSVGRHGAASATDVGVPRCWTASTGTPTTTSAATKTTAEVRCGRRGVRITVVPLVVRTATRASSQSYQAVGACGHRLRLRQVWVGVRLKRRCERDGVGPRWSW